MIKICLPCFLLFLLNFFLCPLALMAQERASYQRAWNKVDSLSLEGLPRSAFSEVEQIYERAREEKNSAMLVKAVIHRMLFQSYIEEDSFSEIVKGLQEDLNASAFPVKQVLHSLLAETYWNYYKENRYRFFNRSTIADSSLTDFRSWDYRRLLEEVIKQYRLSLQEPERQQSTSISVLDGVLEGDKASRFLRPTLYDFLAQRAARFYMTDESNLTPRPEDEYFMDNAALFSDAEAFTHLRLQAADSLSLELKGLELLQKLTRFHLPDEDPSSLVSLDLQRLAYIHRETELAHKDSLYRQALEQLRSKHAGFAVYTEVAYALAETIIKNNKPQLAVKNGQALFNPEEADSSRYIKAAAICEEAIRRFPESLGAGNCRALLDEIRKKELKVKAETINYPGEPFRLLVSYRNLANVYLRVVKLHRSERDSVSFPSWGLRHPGRERALKTLLSRQPVREYHLRLPSMEDHFNHRAEAGIDALPAGHYAVLASETKNFRGDSALLTFTLVQVSALGTFERDRGQQEELYVTDRKTGRPIANATVLIYRQESKPGHLPEKRLERTLLSDINGKIAVRLQKSKLYDALVVLENDTLEAMQNNWIGEERTMRTPKELKNTVFFTDRKVYRPGQTVYFKGFLFRSGEQTMIWPHRKTQVSFSDVNGEKLYELYFTSNEFGTFSGSFIIPVNSLPGKMMIRNEYGSVPVEVAEYKRPTFEVRFEPSDGVFSLNDSVSARGTAVSFSGYPIDKAKVAYTITRRARFQPFRSYFLPPHLPTHIASGVVSTDADGKFEIIFRADARDTSRIYTYQITADVTDLNGETQGGNLAIAIGNRQLEVSMNIGSEVIAGDSLRYEVSAHNLNGETQEAVIHLQVYALDPPSRPLRPRLWEAPNQFLINGEAFRRQFPYDIYADEGAPENWGRAEKCLEKTLDIDSIGQLRLEQLRKCNPGYYVAELTAVSSKGERGAARYYFKLLGEKPGTAQTPDDFITVLSSSGAPGEVAEFLVGPGEPGFVLYELHSGGNITSQHWIKTSGKQEKVQVPISAAAVSEGLAVQFTLVNANRIYNERHEIQAVLPEKKLDIELLSFRNKTRPGEKEQWTVKLSSPGNEQIMAEMVATLYDASLDKISRHSWPFYAFSQGRRPYQPHFPWNTGPFIGGSQPLTLRGGPLPRPSYFRSFEELSDYGYSYYGGHNRSYQRYLQEVYERERQEARIKEWEEAFRKQSQSVKSGTVVSGIVIDEDGNPLPGVSISIKGAASGVFTNSEGEYKIKVPREGVLSFSLIGFKTQEVAPGSKQQIRVRLESDHAALEEVVVVGYATQKKSALVGKVAGVNVSNSDIRIGGLATAELDGMAPPADEGEAGDGSLAGLVDLVPRKNFAETAFFYPHLYTNEEGKISLEFTMPESITRWRMLGFAHTRDLLRGHIEKELVTSKEVSVTANAPRFLRAGDRIVFTAKVVNLTGGPMEGKVQLVLLDALSLEQAGGLLQDAAIKEFSLGASSTGTVSWEIAVPPGLEALTYRVLASAGAYSDGEEKTIPVLPDRILVTETLPLQVDAGETGSFSLDSFAGYGQATARPYRLSLEYTTNPAWYALQSLPYLMEYPYECAEQLFSRYFANTAATRIINSSPRIKAIFSEWKSAGGEALVSTLEKNEELKSALLEETPWVMHAKDETERRKRLTLLFDLNNMQQRNRAVLQKLAQMQLPDGSFPWFPGMQGNRFITQYILAGMGQLRHMDALNTKAFQETQAMLLDALRLVDKEVAGDFEEMASRHKTAEDLSAKDQLNASIIHFMYMRSFYSHIEPSNAAKRAMAFYLDQAEQFWQRRTIYQQGMLALVLHRNGQPETAGKILRSLQERALISPEKGMYWAENRQGYFWYEAPIETQALLIEAFTEVLTDNEQASSGRNAAGRAGTDAKAQTHTGPETPADEKNAPGRPAITAPEAVEQMKKWLLLNKRTNSWETTKATVAACYALLHKGSNWLGAPESTKITLGGSALEVLKPDLKKEAGTGYLKASWEAGEISPEMEDIRISNAGELTSWGALYWQYFEKPENVPASGEGLSIRKTLYKETATESGPVLMPLGPNESLKTGDLLKVRLELSALQDYEFVHLKDLRAAALEPVDILASYRSRDGLGYYQAPRDASMNFFINRLPRGTYVLEYSLRVTHTGSFSNGFAQVQCMYAPGFSARSEGQTITVPGN